MDLEKGFSALMKNLLTVQFCGYVDATFNDSTNMYLHSRIIFFFSISELPKIPVLLVIKTGLSPIDPLLNQL